MTPSEASVSVRVWEVVMPGGSPMASSAVRNRLLFGPVNERLQAAREVLERHEMSLRADPGLAAAVGELTERSRDLEHVMSELTLGEACATCATGPTGGCCSAVMMEEVDGPLLLMNALTGRSLPIPREDDFECGFLGSGGCVLRPKPIFCLNYLCKPLRAELSRSELAELARATDALLLAQTQLETLLIEKISAL